MSQKLEFHPVADLFPWLQGDVFQKQVADIRQNGLLEPILVDAQRRIIDGRNRYLACLEAGVEPRFTEWQGEGVLPELALSLNLHRRHLNESQRALAQVSPSIIAGDGNHYRISRAGCEDDPYGASR